MDQRTWSEVDYLDHWRKIARPKCGCLLRRIVGLVAETGLDSRNG